MSIAFRFAESFHKLAAAPVATMPKAPTMAAPVNKPNFAQRAWGGMSTAGRNALVSGIGGGVINMMRGGDFTTGAVLGAGAGYGATKAGLLNTDLGTKGMQAVGVNPFGYNVQAGNPRYPKPAPAPGAAPAAPGA